jgi:hypothetical protein
VARFSIQSENDVIRAAMQVYAYKAKDAALVREVVGIRKLAERRLGELMKAAPKAKGGDQGGPSSKKLGRAKTQLTRLRRSPSRASTST